MTDVWEKKELTLLQKVFGPPLILFMVLASWMHSLVKLATFKLPWNQFAYRILYPQFWLVRPHFMWRQVQDVCDVFVGHELSETEWGYGGGEYADLHCRWCDRCFQVRLEDTYDKFPHARQMAWKMNQLGGCESKDEAVKEIRNFADKIG